MNTVLKLRARARIVAGIGITLSLGVLAVGCESHQVIQIGDSISRRGELSPLTRSTAFNIQRGDKSATVVVSPIDLVVSDGLTIHEDARVEFHNSRLSLELKSGVVELDVVAGLRPIIKSDNIITAAPGTKYRMFSFGSGIGDFVFVDEHTGGGEAVRVWTVDKTQTVVLARHEIAVYDPGNRTLRSYTPRYTGILGRSPIEQAAKAFLRTVPMGP